MLDDYVGFVTENVKIDTNNCKQNVINVDKTLHNLQKINSRSIINPYGDEITRNQLIMLPEAIHSSELDNLLQLIDKEEEISHNFVQNNSAIIFA